MRLCDALLSTNTSVSRRSSTLPLSVRNGRSTSQRCLNLVVPFAATMRAEFERRLHAIAMDILVTRCMPGPVSPSQINFAPAAAIAGMDCMTAVWIDYARGESRKLTKRSSSAASPRMIFVISSFSTLQILKLCGKLRRISAARARLPVRTRKLLAKA
eukprot:1532701-Pleurochrysis_carterae.AAC.2